MGVELSLVCSVLTLILRSHVCWSESTLLVPSQPLVVPVGSDVTLPCQLDPVKDIKDLVVEWSRPDLTPRYVHIRRDGLDLLIEQNSLYLGRTGLRERGLQVGDMSLQLSRARLSDGGTYRCFIPQMDTGAEVTLTVVSVSPVSVSLNKRRSGSPELRCQSRGWYPEPELVWLDSEGTVLTGERTEVQRGASDETFTVSSRLSVEHSPENTFTCRVRHQDSSQSRESQISITGDFLEPCSSCAVAWTLFVLGLCLAAAAGAFFLWKYKIQKTPAETKSVNGEVKVEKREESEPLLKDPQSQEQKLNEHREACSRIREERSRITEEIRFITESETLQETKDFLVKLKDALHRCCYELNNDNEVKQNKIDETVINKNSDKNKKRQNQIKKNASQLKLFDDIMNLTNKEMSKIDEIMRKSTERKGKLNEELKQTNKLLEKEEKRVEAAVEFRQSEVKLFVPEETTEASEHSDGAQHEEKEEQKLTEINAPVTQNMDHKAQSPVSDEAQRETEENVKLITDGGTPTC